jgi:hypothetical protein
MTTHVAYADESYTKHRYRSIGVISLPVGCEEVLSNAVSAILKDSGIAEFKWSKLRQARERFAALKLVDFAVKRAIANELRVDVLMWDTEDSRHRIHGRDDEANLQRMYIQLFRNVLQRRWPTGSTWRLCPDENSAMDWGSVQDRLDQAGVDLSIEGDIFSKEPFKLRLSREFAISEIREAVSSHSPICQVADLFAGIGPFSHASFEEYATWCRQHSGQLPLDLADPSGTTELAGSDIERCQVLQHLDGLCKASKLRVGLNSCRGLKTYDPAFPVNYWMYEPQRPDDKAPVRAGRVDQG